MVNTNLGKEDYKVYKYYNNKNKLHAPARRASSSCHSTCKMRPKNTKKCPEKGIGSGSVTVTKETFANVR